MDQFNRLKLGLNYYTSEEIKTLGEEQKRSVIYDQNKFWSIVNALKQLKMTSILNKVFFNYFPNASQTETLDILLKPVIDHNFTINRDIKELNIPADIICRECVKKGLLPNNFLS